MCNRELQKSLLLQLKKPPPVKGRRRSALVIPPVTMYRAICPIPVPVNVGNPSSPTCICCQTPSGTQLRSDLLLYLTHTRLPPSPALYRLYDQIRLRHRFSIRLSSFYTQRPILSIFKYPKFRKTACTAKRPFFIRETFSYPFLRATAIIPHHFPFYRRIPRRCKFLYQILAITML